jgi:hypothetical protein
MFVGIFVSLTLVYLSLAYPCGPRFDFAGPVSYLQVNNLLPDGAAKTVSMWISAGRNQELPGTFR